jgi:hypothetical protein
MLKQRLWASAAGLLVSLALLPAPSASAHDANAICVYDEPGGICRGRGGVYVNHQVVWNYDNYADGKGSRTWYIYGDGELDYIADPDGFGGRRGEEVVPGGLQAVWYQVCYGPVNAEIRCTDWRRP